MPVLDKSVVNDARRLLCGILGFFDRCGEWPTGGSVNQMSSYKKTDAKAEVVQYLLENKFIEIRTGSTSTNRICRFYVVTPAGRDAVSPPEPLPRVVGEYPTPFPDDEVESAIYSYHYAFFQRRGRWPNGEERVRAFAGTRRATSPARRQHAYESLVDDGTLVHVYFWNGPGQTDSYILTEYAPEYADKHEWLFYAPTDTT
jgi:hypothetical protein